MKRDIDHLLFKWKNSEVRQPLLVRGARQVGKSYTIANFGNKHFKNYVVINFEERPEFIKCFLDYNIRNIIDKLSILTNAEITPGETLLFLDEIQECPNAITALRYFYEKLPDLHIIGAGSLVEFILSSEKFKMPVGRIQSLFMSPLSFGEFLDEVTHSKLRNYLKTVTLKNGIDTVFKKELETLLKQYLILGGMPKIVDSYSRNVGMDQIKNLQTSIIQTYQADFGKYASTVQHKYLKEIFNSAPRMVGKRYKYSKVTSSFQARDLRNALQLLNDAGILSVVYHTSGHGIPFEAEINKKKFKLLFLDVGLMQRALGLDTSLLLANDILIINSGSVAEQYVGQELLAMHDYFEEKKIFFWARDKKGSSSEIDYLVNIGSKTFPVEVKAGKTGRLKSMRMFLNEHKDSPFGIRFSMHELSWYDGILSIPLYMIDQFKRLSNDIDNF